MGDLSDDYQTDCYRTRGPETTDIGYAIGQLKRGRTVTRAGWNGKGMHLGIMEPEKGSDMSLPFIYLKTVDGKYVPWTASQTDLLANDWAVIS